MPGGKSKPKPKIPSRRSQLAPFTRVARDYLKRLHYSPTEVHDLKTKVDRALRETRDFNLRVAENETRTGEQEDARLIKIADADARGAGCNPPEGRTPPGELSRYVPRNPPPVQATLTHLKGLAWGAMSAAQRAYNRRGLAASALGLYVLLRARHNQFSVEAGKEVRESVGAGEVLAAAVLATAEWKGQDDVPALAAALSGRQFSPMELEQIAVAISQGNLAVWALQAQEVAEFGQAFRDTQERGREARREDAQARRQAWRKAAILITEEMPWKAGSYRAWATEIVTRLYPGPSLGSRPFEAIRRFLAQEFPKNRP